MSALLSGDNVPFLAALLLMLLIGVVEAAGLGGGLGDGVDGDLDADGPSILSWLNVGRLPMLMLIIVFLFSFGMLGLIGQQLAAALFGRPAPWLLATPLAFAAALPITRIFGAGVSRILPRDETSAVSRESLVGRVAVVVTGRASAGSAAQARVRDQHGQSHYVMVEPDDSGDTFPEGSSVLLVRHAGARYFAIPNPSASLLDRAN